MKNFNDKNKKEKRTVLQDGQEPAKKKALGQHFLRKQSTVDHMIDKVKIDANTTVLEIGCGDGFLTRSILEQTPCKKLICYEIDPEWAEVVRSSVRDSRLEIRLQNILTVDFNVLRVEMPLVVLANLPYQITFPIVTLFQQHKHLFQEGVVMVQEEVAQKLAATSGRNLAPASLFFQYHFDIALMEKIEPGAFNPPPKVFSRLVYFRPVNRAAIKQEEGFWKFLKLCFQSPRQTLKNNLRTTHFDRHKINQELLQQRAQQLTFNDFLSLWEILSP